MKKKTKKLMRKVLRKFKRKSKFQRAVKSVRGLMHI